MLKRTLIAILCLMTMAGSTACIVDCNNPSNADICEDIEQYQGS